MQRQHNTSATRVSTRLVRAAAVAVALLTTVVTLAAAHDMFIRPAAFFIAENSEGLVRVLNGTFSKSENSIARARLLDISVVSPAGRERLDTSAWSDAGDTSTFRVRTGAAGTYVLGASTRPSMIELSGDTFNLYLREDGIPDALAERRREGQLGARARERYSKHVKAVIQVGRTRTDDYATELGYPAELVPVRNPYDVKVGQVLRLKTLVDGNPVANQYVLFGGRTANGGRIAQRHARSDSAGVVAIPIRTRGTWYVKFIHMARPANDPEANYESKWATITFQVR